MTERKSARWGGGDSLEGAFSPGGVRLCGACQRVGECRLGFETEQLVTEPPGRGELRCELRCPADHEGGPGVAHGGWTAAALDELLGHTPLHHGQLTVTGTLTVRFVKPVPIDRPLLGRARVDRVEGSKWFISGELLLAGSGALLASGTGVWIARDRDAHFRGFENWLASQDGGPPA
jgi:acyl-coenzyme A thioesterase PaaI-like protein